MKKVQTNIYDNYCGMDKMINRWKLRHNISYNAMGFIFLIALWGAPIPFNFARPKNVIRTAEASLRGELNLKAYVHIMIWIVLGILFIWNFSTSKKINILAYISRSLIFKLLVLFITCSIPSLLLSHGLALSIFRTYQLVILFLLLMFDLNEKEKNAFPLVKLFNYYCIFHLCYNIVLFFVYPKAVILQSFSREGDRLIGGWLLNSDYGVAALIVLFNALSFLTYNSSKKIIIYILIICSTFALILSGTRILFLCTMASLFFFIISSYLDKYVRVLLLCVFLIFLCFLPFYAIELNNLLGRSPGSLLDGSGRLHAWSIFLNHFFSFENIWFGCGYASGGRYISTRFFDQSFGNMHNMYLEVLVDFGIIGLISFMFLIIVTLLKGAYLLSHLNHSNFSPNDKQNILASGLLFISFLVFGITANSFMEEFQLPTFAFALSLVLLAHYDVKSRMQHLEK